MVFTDRSSRQSYMKQPEDFQQYERTRCVTDQRPQPGTIIWHDLTVPDASALRDFYAEVTGWRPEAVQIHDHDDYNMIRGDDEQPTAGICHAIGELADLPPQWLMYVVVADIEQSATRCKALGGRLITQPGDDGLGGKFCVIQDPAGAVMAIIQPA
jgi:uncharacterized protein